MKRSDITGKTYIRSYLWERSAFIVWTGLTAVIFLVLAGLYGYEYAIVPMSYALVIILFFLLAYLCFDYYRYRSRGKKLKEVLARKGERDYDLPEPLTGTEAIYQEMVYALETEKRQLITQMDEQREEMSNYYTMWTHQIKTPIAALKLLQEDGVTGEACYELFRIEQYVDMVLQYARLYSLSSDMLFHRHEIGALIKGVVKKYSRLIIGRKLSFAMEEFTCFAVTDEKWVSFVIDQVLSNAVKYTEAGGIRIYGSDEVGELCKGQVTTIVIEDTGIGIRQEDLPRVFERGFTGYNGRMDKKSTGIGLYLCRQIMDKLGHAIKAESVQGQGTKILLSFMREQ